jgi:hypothetical protein
MASTTKQILLLPGPQWPELSFAKESMSHQKSFMIKDRPIYAEIGDSGIKKHEEKTAFSVWDGVWFFYPHKRVLYYQSFSNYNKKGKRRG